MSKSVSIILAVIDELENLEIIIPYFISSSSHLDIEIIVVEDAIENDGIENFITLQNNSCIKYIKGDDLGLTAAIKKGINACSKDLVYWSDSDLSHPPEMLHEMLKYIDEGEDIVVCSRFLKGSLDETYKESNFIFFHKILSRLLSILCRSYLELDFRDYSSGFILIKRDVLDRLVFTGDYGEYFMELIYRSLKQGYKVMEIPFYSPKRRFGVSKTATNFAQLFSRGYKYLLKISEIRSL